MSAPASPTTAAQTSRVQNSTLSQSQFHLSKHVLHPTSRIHIYTHTQTLSLLVFATWLAYPFAMLHIGISATSFELVIRIRIRITVLTTHSGCASSFLWILAHILQGRCRTVDKAPCTMCWSWHQALQKPLKYKIISFYCYSLEVMVQYNCLLFCATPTHCLPTPFRIHCLEKTTKQPHKSTLLMLFTVALTANCFTIFGAHAASRPSAYMYTYKQIIRS